MIVLGDVNTSHRPIDHCDPSDIVSSRLEYYPRKAAPALCWSRTKNCLHQGIGIGIILRFSKAWTFSFCVIKCTRGQYNKHEALDINMKKLHNNLRFLILITQEDFEENPGRKWLNGFLQNEKDPDEVSEVSVHGGKFLDTFRYFHPTRTGAFTCWSTLTGARQTNYGTRIDYIFADCKLAKEQFLSADILPEVEGSDHCPVWGELICSLLPSSKPPPLSTCHLPEFAGKQQKLSRFLVKMDHKSIQSEPRDSLPGSQEEGGKRENVNICGAGNLSGKKRTLTADSGIPKGKKTKTCSKPQGSLLAFFKPKFTNVSSNEAPSRQCEKTHNPHKVSTLTDAFTVKGGVPEEAELVCEGAPQLCTTEDQQSKAEHLTSHTAVGHSQAKTGASFWKSVLHGPPPPPACKGHGQPCVLRTVKKEGTNMGRQFFVCARPQGHASNPEARCNFFAWVDKGK